MLFPLSLSGAPLTKAGSFAALTQKGTFSITTIVKFYTSSRIVYFSLLEFFFKGKEQRNFVGMYQHPSLCIALDS